jgi:predicted Zn-dependent protease
MAETAWSGDAEAVLAPFDEDGIAPILKAEHLIAAGDTRAAEDILLDNQESPRALELLAELAESAEEWSRAVPLLEALLKQAPSPARRLRYAETLLKGGRRRDALAVLAAFESTQPSPRH